MISLGNKNIGKTGVDWGSVIIFFVLMILGWINIYATVYDEAGVVGFDFSQRYGSQLIWMGICVVAAVIIMLIDDIYYHVLAYPFYVLMILALLSTLVFGVEIKGNTSWIRLGGFSIQPAEFGKIAVALALAKVMSSPHFTLNNRRDVLVVLGILVLPMLIITFLQHDTGSAVVYLAFMIMLFREGLNPWIYVVLGMVVTVFVFSFIVKPGVLIAIVLLICVAIEGVMNGRWKQKLQYLAVVGLSSVLLFILLNLMFTRPVSYYVCLLTASVLSLGLVAMYMYRNKLKNVFISISLFFGSLVFYETVELVFGKLPMHQQKRILNLLGVESDIHNVGYNVVQSKIAIGSGGFSGKGYLKGTQTQYDFVPEQSTDFIFSTVGEEWGFIGSAVVLGLFCWLILRLVRMAERMQEPFGRVYCYCVASLFFMHVVINVGMTVGLMPVIGIPLPLFSYGGSSLLAFTILFFIAVKLDSSRKESGGYGAGRK